MKPCTRVQFSCIVLVVNAANMVGADEAGECYTLNDGRNKTCFHYASSSSDKLVGVSWSEARQFCQSINSTLPIITDEHIHNALQQFINDGHVTREDVWIGAHAGRVDDSVPWHWIDGRTSGLTSSDLQNHAANNWCTSAGTVNAHTELYANVWYDDLYGYICEYDCDISDTPTTQWLAFPGEPSHGASKNSATSTQQCREMCLNDTNCAAFEWNSEHRECWIHNNSIGVGYFYYYNTLYKLTPGCRNADCTVNTFRVDGSSKCYKWFHTSAETDRVRWFTAVNRCLSFGGHLASFDDNIRRCVGVAMPTQSQRNVWIGLVKSAWTWADSGDTDDLITITTIPPPATMLTSSESRDSNITTTTTISQATMIGIGVGVGSVLLIIIIIIVTVVAVIRCRTSAPPSSGNKTVGSTQTRTDQMTSSSAAGELDDTSHPDVVVYATVTPTTDRDLDLDKFKITGNHDNDVVVYSDLREIDAAADDGDYSMPLHGQENTYANV